MNIKYSIINATVKQEKITINKNYYNYHNMYYYKYAGRHDRLLIRFFNNRVYPE